MPNTLLTAFPIATHNYLYATFFVGIVAMFAVSALFFFKVSKTNKKWHVSVFVSGLIAFIPLASGMEYYKVVAFYFQ